MTQKNNPQLSTVLTPLSFRRMLIGAAIALLLITCFLSGAPAPDPAWGKFWMIRPLIIVPFAGACGGLFYHLMDPLRTKGGWKKVTANALSLMVFIIGLWLGTVLGFAGTMWN